MNHHADIRRAAEIVAEVRRAFVGKPPGSQGAALAELLALFIAGHHPDLREEILRLHVDTVRWLVPIVEHEIGDPWDTSRGNDAADEYE